MHFDPIFASGPYLTGEAVFILFLVVLLGPALGVAHLVISIRGFAKRRTIRGILCLMAGGLFVIPVWIFSRTDGDTAFAALAVGSLLCGAGWLFVFLKKRFVK